MELGFLASPTVLILCGDIVKCCSSCGTETRFPRKDESSYRQCSHLVLECTLRAGGKENSSEISNISSGQAVGNSREAVQQIAPFFPPFLLKEPCKFALAMQPRRECRDTKELKHFKVTLQGR